jgi:hypothetical protein
MKEHEPQVFNGLSGVPEHIDKAIRLVHLRKQIHRTCPNVTFCSCRPPQCAVTGNILNDLDKSCDRLHKQEEQ